jgi:hypothetical protein
MAIDTLEKRISMLNFSAGDLLPYPPDVAEVSLEDRLTFLDLYSGPPPAQLLVTGPWKVPAKELFSTGATAGQVFHTGQAAGQSFHTGAVAGEMGADR